MSYDHYRAGSPQNDRYANPYRIKQPTDSGGSAGVLLFGALSLFAVAGFIYFFGTNDRETRLTNDMRPSIIQPDNSMRVMPRETTRYP